MKIVYHESSKTFHLYNDTISYIMLILKNGHLGQLYCGKLLDTFVSKNSQNDSSFTVESGFGTGRISPIFWRPVQDL